jgi:CubicO group peptidase (beta-lactamase class C family)
MRMLSVRFTVRAMVIAASVALALLGSGSRLIGGGAEPSGCAPGAQAAKDDPDDSLTPPDLVWFARIANRQGKYDDAARRARAVTRRSGVVPEVLCAAWMNIFYAAHRTGDKNAAAAALRSFDESAARVPANDPVVIEMGELKEALGLGGGGAPAAVAAPSEGDGFWQSADPAALGLDAGAIREHLALAKASGADAFLIAFRGKVVSEWYSPRYRTPAFTMSSVKSITGLLAGLLVADGKLAVDDPVSRFVPGWAEGRRGRVSIRHLLTMSAGLARTVEPSKSVGFAANKNAFVMGLEPTSEPGSRWDYSNEGVQLLAPVLEKAAGVPLQEYARDRLFRPVGMAETRLHVDGNGQAWTYADAETTLRDFARLGELMRNKGRFRGRAIVAEAWVEASTRPCPLSPEYGYLWWLIADPKGFAAKGYLDTHCYVFPDLELVVARIQARQYLFATESYEPKALALFKRIVRK